MNTCIAMWELWLMWAFGGGGDWSRERIDKELESAVDILRQQQAIA